MANGTVSAEAAIQNFFEKFVNPLYTIERASERAAMEEAMVYASTDDKTKKQSALAWQKRSLMYRQIWEMVLNDPLLTDEQKSKLVSIRTGTSK